MGRKLSFCKDDALAKATAMFGQRGYEKTCMRDVANELSVPVASLYHSFGDKNALLTAALEAYYENIVKPKMIALAAAEHPMAAIEQHFANLIACYSNPDENARGCIMLHAAGDLVSQVPEAAKLAKQMMKFSREQFTAAVTRGQEMGEITKAHNAEFLSAHLMANVIAIKTWLRMGPAMELLQNYTRQMLGILRA